MKEEIEKFKRTNGNVTYSTKELIGALHEKIDDINHKLDGMVCTSDCLRRKQSVLTYVNRMYGILFTLLSALAGYVLLIK